VRVRKADPALARRQARWIAAIDPWRSLGYQAAALGRWLARSARAGQVQVAGEGEAVIVVQPDVLLGSFIALLAVRPEAAGQGLGRALVEHVARQTWKRRRWLYTSSDSQNTAAARFYRKLGFTRIARLPDLVRPGRLELLWRLARPG
jgi:ribosomal protein S18 acetylase RimI-like enzyme